MFHSNQLCALKLRARGLQHCMDLTLCGCTSLTSIKCLKIVQCRSINTKIATNPKLRFCCLQTHQLTLHNHKYAWNACLPHGGMARLSCPTCRYCFSTHSHLVTVVLSRCLTAGCIHGAANYRSNWSPQLLLQRFRRWLQLHCVYWSCYRIKDEEQLKSTSSSHSWRLRCMRSCMSSHIIFCRSSKLWESCLIGTEDIVWTTCRLVAILSDTGDVTAALSAAEMRHLETVTREPSYNNEAQHSFQIRQFAGITHVHKFHIHTCLLTNYCQIARNAPIGLLLVS